MIESLEEAETTRSETTEQRIPLRSITQRIADLWVSHGGIEETFRLAIPVILDEVRALTRAQKKRRV